MPMLERMVMILVQWFASGGDLRRNALRPTALIVVLLFGLGCSEKRGRGESPNYPVLDSGYVIADNHEPYWLDNDRIIFIGLRPGQPPPKPMEALVDAYIWDTRTNQVKLDMKDAAGVCFFRDEIRYTVRPPDGSVKMLRGRLGDLNEIDVDKVKRDAQMQSADVLRQIHSLCDSTRFEIQFPSWRDPKDGRVKIALLEGHGYLDLGDSPFGGDYPIRYYSASQTEGMNLPIKIWEMDPALPRHVPLKNAYLIYGSRTSAKSPYSEWPKDLPRSMYLLYPGGHVDKIQLAPGEYIRPGGASYYIVRQGTLVVSRDMRALDDIRGGSIAYLVQGQRVTPVWSRILGSAELSVSPDGCRVAAKVSTKAEPSRTPTLRMINLCNNGAR